jgi:hypothetical protein
MVCVEEDLEDECKECAEMEGVRDCAVWKDAAELETTLIR